MIDQDISVPELSKISESLYRESISHQILETEKGTLPKIKPMTKLRVNNDTIIKKVDLRTRNTITKTSSKRETQILMPKLPTSLKKQPAENPTASE